MKKLRTDRRTERTRAALMGAFVDVLLSDGYDTVTVERVAERANVGRSTFYMHFAGREDILRRSLARPSSHLAVIVGREVATEMLVPILDHFHEQRRRNHVFFAWPIRSIWVKCLADMIEPRLAAISHHCRARPVLPLQLIALQIAEAQIALIANWLLVSNTAKKEAVAEALIATTQAMLAALLRSRPDTPLLVPGEGFRLAQADKAKL